MSPSLRYEDRGASADKKEVHAAIQRRQHPGAFGGDGHGVLPVSGIGPILGRHRPFVGAAGVTVVDAFDRKAFEDATRPIRDVARRDPILGGLIERTILRRRARSRTL